MNTVSSSPMAGTQGFAWRGKTIPPVDFEIAVTAATLRPSEVKVLLKP